MHTIDSFINGVPKSTAKVVKVFEISESQWPAQSQKVPQESEAFVRFMVHVSRWRRRNLCPNTNGVNGNTLTTSFKIINLDLLKYYSSL